MQNTIIFNKQTLKNRNRKEQINAQTHTAY
jgi:hypothetical protein